MKGGKKEKDFSLSLSLSLSSLLLATNGASFFASTFPLSFHYSATKKGVYCTVSLLPDDGTWQAARRIGRCWSDGNVYSSR